MLVFVILVKDVSQKEKKKRKEKKKKNVIYSSCSEWCLFKPCVLFFVWMVCSPDVDVYVCELFFLSVVTSLS